MTRFTAGADMSVVLKCADRNLYAAKRNGKDCVHLDGMPVCPASTEPSAPEAP